MKQFGLAAWVSFQDKGVSTGMDKIGSRADRLKKKFAGISAGASQFGRGLGQMAIGFAPVTLGLAGIIKQGAEFEQSIANLRAKMLGGFDPALKELAKTLGATTSFSASQAAEAMKMLAQSNFDAAEITKAVPGVLSAAAAEGMSLATAASLVAGNVRAFGIDAKESSRVAGILALASSKANTDMVSLNEGLKLAAASSKLVGGKLADTAAVLGALADIGLQGSMSGTAFRAAMTKLLKPTKEVKGAVGDLGLSMGILRKKLNKGDVVGTFQTIVKRLSKIRKSSTRASTAVKIFGVRGVALANALKQGDKDVARFNSTLTALRNETGSTADRMAKVQLGTLTGQMKLLKSATEGVAIEIFGMISQKTSLSVKGLVKRVSQLALALQVVNGKVIVDPKQKKELKSIPPVIFDIAQGIKEGFAGVRKVFSDVFGMIKKAGSALGFEFGGKGTKAVAATTTKFLVLGAAIAPIGVALLVATKLATGLFNAAAGGVRMVSSSVRLLGSAGKGIGGILSKIPVLGKVMPRLGGALGKVGGALGSLTAMPVFVTNMGAGGMLGGGAANALGGLAGQTAATAAATATLRQRFNTAILRLPLLGNALTMTTGAFTAAGTSLLAKGGFIAAIGAAGFAGWKFGQFLDKKFGISSKLANWMDKVLPRALGGGNKAAADARVKTHSKFVGIVQGNEMAKSLLKLQRAGKSVQLKEGGKRQAITRELAEARIAQFLRAQGQNQAQITLSLRNMESIFRQFKPGAKAGGTKAPVKPLKPAKDAIALSGGLVPVSAGDVVLDRASLAAAVTSQLRGGLAGRAGSGLLGGGDPGQTTPPQAKSGGSEGGGAMTIQVPLNIDGRQIALAVAEVRLDDIERSGGRLEPGDRSALLTRGFLGGSR